jgi:hypothetical protein
MAASHVMKLLDHGVPITLLCDLASLADPESTAINSAERADTDWIWQEAAESYPAQRKRRRRTDLRTGSD